MTQKAIVTKLIAPGICSIKVRRESACAHECDDCQAGCSSPHEIVEVFARNNAKAKPGDFVVIESSTGNTLALAALLYLVPLVLFFIGWFFHAVAGVVGLLIGLGFCFFANNQLQKNGGIPISVVEVLPNSESEIEL